MRCGSTFAGGCSLCIRVVDDVFVHLLGRKYQRIDAPVLVVEVQFQHDEQLYTRLVSETALLQMQYPERKKWQMLLVLPSRSIDVDAGIWEIM